MSRKNKFKKRKEHAVSEVEHEESHHEIAGKKEEEYDMKSDFINLFVIIFFFTGILIGLYYYDMQSHILNTVADRLINSI